MKSSSITDFVYGKNINTNEIILIISFNNFLIEKLANNFITKVRVIS